MNPYEVLGIEKTADQAAIKKAFRKLALELHPDKNPGDKQKEEKFKEVSAAYDILSDPQKRSNYDQFGTPTQPQPQYNPFNGINIEDLFGGFNRRDKRSVFKGDDLYKDVRLEFMEAITGCKKTIKVSYSTECSKCKGIGAKDGTEFSSCQTCGGAGKTGVTQGFMHIFSTCRTCSGTGRKIETKCSFCFGSGQKLKEEKLNLTIPAGIEENTTMRLAGKGLPGINGGPNGDLYVTISITPHPKFKRENSSIYLNEQIDYTDALLGCNKEVDTIYGKRNLTVPELTKHGSVIKMAGCGVNIDNKTGDQFVRIEINIPDKMTDKERELLKEIKEQRKEQDG